MARNILNDLSYAPSTSNFVGGVDFGVSLEKLDAQYRQMDEFNPGVLDTLQADSAISNEYKNYVQSQMDLAASSNPFEANRIFKRTIKNDANFRADRNHVFGATQYNKNLYAQGLKENEEVKTDQSIKDLKHKISLHNYKKVGGVGEYDPVTGKAIGEKGFNNFNFQKANEAVDEEDIVSKYGTGWASDQTTFGGVDVTPNGKFIYKNAGTKEFVRAGDVANYVYNNLLGNNQWLAAERDKQELNLYRELSTKTDSKGNPIYSEDQILDIIQNNPAINKRISDRALELANQEGSKRGFQKIDRDLDLSQTRKGTLSDEQEAMQLVPPQTVVSQVYNNPNAVKDVMIPETLNPSDAETYMKKAGYTYEVTANPGGQVTARYFKYGKPIDEAQYKAKFEGVKSTFSKLKDGNVSSNEMHNLLREQAESNPAFAKIYSDFYQANRGKKMGTKDYYSRLMKLYNSKIKATSTLADTLVFMDADDIEKANRVMLNGQAVFNQRFYNKETGAFEDANTFFKRELKIDLSTESGQEAYDKLLKSNRISISNQMLPINDEAGYQLIVNGKAHRMTGTLEQTAEFAPVIQASRVLSQNLPTAGNGVKLSNAKDQLPVSIAFNMSNDGKLRINQVLKDENGKPLPGDGKERVFDEAPLDFTNVMGIELPEGQRILGYTVADDQYDDEKNPSQVVQRNAYFMFADDVPFLGVKKGQMMPYNDIVKKSGRMSITRNAFNIPGKNTGNQVDLKLRKGTERTTN